MKKKTTKPVKTKKTTNRRAKSDGMTEEQRRFLAKLNKLTSNTQELASAFGDFTAKAIEVIAMLGKTEPTAKE